jgi:hypothetical protein
MLNENAVAVDVVGCTVDKNSGVSESSVGKGVYKVQCIGADGVVKWEEEMSNLTTNVGRQNMNAVYFSSSAATATWYLGLVDGASAPTYANGDTALTHTGWTENTGYSNATRVTCTFGTATTASPSVITNSASPAAFNMNATSTIAGAFLISNSTKGGTTGTLFSEARFSSPGNRSVVSGDTLNVTYTFNLS